MRRTVPLGDSAFVADKEDFLPADIETEKKPLQKRGAENGRLNSPDSDAIHPDDVEQGVVQKVAQTVQQTQAGLSQHLVGFHESLVPIVETWDATAKINQVREEPRAVESALNDRLGRFETESTIRRRKWGEAEKDYDAFRKENNLTRPADYASIVSIMAWFSSLIALEAIFNATLLWELTGFLLALGQTALITIVNVLFGASMMGLCLRYNNHASFWVRWRVLICVPVIILVLVFNVGVGHYRDALVEAREQTNQFLVSPDWDDAGTAFIEPDFTDFTRRAMENITDCFLCIDSILSVLLIIVGIGFFGLATYKWYSIWDPYPGYRKRDLMFKKAHENYENLVDATRKQMKKEIDDALARVADESIKVINMRKRYNELINRAASLRQSFTGWSVMMGQTQMALLEAYRSGNRQARSEPAPGYFDKEIAIDDKLVEPPCFEPPALGDTDTVVEAVKLATESINGIAGQKWAKFDQVANMRHRPDETG